MDEPAQEKARQARPIGRDEMNLAEFPIALLSERAPKGMKTLTFRDGAGTLTVTGSDAYGLPTAADSDVLIGLIQLTKEANNFRNPKVPFTRYALLKLLEWPMHSHYYNRLGESLKRWHGVSLNYEQLWWDNNVKTKIDASFHILESVIIVDTPPRRGGRVSSQIELPLSTFTWNQVFFKSCGDGNLKRLDLGTYFSLKSAVSKRMYRFLDKRFYLRPDWTFGLREFALEHVGLGRNYADNGKLKEKLRPAIEELETIGFLEKRDYESRFNQVRRGAWSVMLSRKAPQTLSQPVPDEPEASELVGELVNRGVARETATELVGDYPHESIRLQIEVLDWRVSQKTSKIADPPAWLVGAIRKGFDEPKNFVSKSEQKRRDDAKQEVLRSCLLYTSPSPRD